MAIQFEERQSARRLVDWESRGLQTLKVTKTKGLPLFSHRSIAKR